MTGPTGKPQSINQVLSEPTPTPTYAPIVEPSNKESSFTLILGSSQSPTYGRLGMPKGLPPIFHYTMKLAGSFPKAVLPNLTKEEQARLDAAHTDDELLVIVKDKKSSLALRFEAADIIKDGQKRDEAFAAIAQDPDAEAGWRLKATDDIKDPKLKDACLVPIASDENVDGEERFYAVGNINEPPLRKYLLTKFILDSKIDGELRQDAIDHLGSDNILKNAVRAAIVFNKNEDAEFRLRIAEGTEDAKMRNTLLTMIAYDKSFSDTQRKYAIEPLGPKADKIRVSLAMKKDEKPGFRLMIANEIEDKKKKADTLAKLTKEGITDEAKWEKI